MLAELRGKLFDLGPKTKMWKKDRMIAGFVTRK